MSLADVLSAIDAEIARIETARALLTRTGGGKRGRTKRTFSAATRKRMAAAQRKRWATVRKAAK